MDALPQLARLSISLPAELLTQLDDMVAERALPSRSQMIAELIRHELAEHSESRDDAVLARDAHSHLPGRKRPGPAGAGQHPVGSCQGSDLLSARPARGRSVLEVLLVQGPAPRLHSLCDGLRKVRGVQQIKFGYDDGSAAATALAWRRGTHRSRGALGSRWPVSRTADPHGAQAHARAMGSTRVEAMPTLPASAAAARPAGVVPATCCGETTLGAGGYASKELARGARLQLQDLQGDACVSMLIFNAERPVERLNVAGHHQGQWNAYLGTGKLLLLGYGAGS